MTDVARVLTDEVVLPGLSFVGHLFALSESGCQWLVVGGDSEVSADYVEL